MVIMSWVDDLPYRKEGELSFSFNPITLWKVIKKIRRKLNERRREVKSYYGRNDPKTG